MVSALLLESVSLQKNGAALPFTLTGLQQTKGTCATDGVLYEKIASVAPALWLTNDNMQKHVKAAENAEEFVDLLRT